jgi:hypothetical protein
MKKIFLSILIGVDILGCQSSQDNPKSKSKSIDPTKNNTNNAVAYVDSIPIYPEELNARCQQAFAYNFKPEQFTLSVALINIIQDLIEYNISLRYNVAPTPTQIDSFAQWVNQNTRDAALLNKVKQCYNGETKEYKNIYLRPILVNKAIRKYFAFHKEYHQKPWECMNKALELVNQSKSLSQIYQLLKPQYDTLFYQQIIFSENESNTNPKDEWKVLPNYLAPPFLDTLKPNTTYKEIYDEQYSLSIWHKVKKDKKGIWCYVLSYPKNNFEEWLHKEAETLKIVIQDSVIKTDIQKNYNHLWWMKLL